MSCIVVAVMPVLKQILRFACLSPHICRTLLYNSPAKLILICVIEKRVVGKLVYMCRLCHIKGFVNF